MTTHINEQQWQRRWEDTRLFAADRVSLKPKYYVLEMYPYPSGELHMGHVRNYLLGDVVARYKRMRGFSVLHPIGWDAFGLPTENAALARGIEPTEWNRQCTERMRRQFQSLGISYDWDRVIDTSDPSYYRWTQWLLLRFWERNLLYRQQSTTNWCIGCQTVLANSQVREDKTCERCCSAVTLKEMPQWFLRVTDYAQRLWDDLDLLTEWPERVKAMQRYWIGKKDDGTFRIHDWSISRQRYWGAPIPFVECDKCGTVPMRDSDLPVLLPSGIDFTPGWPPPLARSLEFVSVTCHTCGHNARRITDTLDTFVFSAWYYLRFTDPHNNEMPFNPDIANYWMPVDQYVGGIEHATVHLVYARFFHKVLYDLGLVKYKEPFQRLFTQGMVCYRGEKMSKSRGNTVTPDPLVEKYGADATRLYTLFVGPPDQDIEWSDDGFAGCERFLRKLTVYLTNAAEYYQPEWHSRLQDHTLSEQDTQLRQSLHTTLRDVTISIEYNFRFHTAIARLMSWLGKWAEVPMNNLQPVVVSEAVETLTLFISPFAPHLAEDIWNRLGNQESIAFQSWPVVNPSLINEKEVGIVVQINGKKRTTFQISSSRADDQEAVEKIARATESVRRVADKITRVIFVPYRIINFVTGP